MQKIEVFQTSDGAFFTDENMARKHQAICNMNPQIDAFIASKFCTYSKSATQKMAVNVIRSWEKFKESTK